MKVIKHIGLRFFIIPIEEHLFTEPAAYESKIEWFTQSFLSNLDLTTKKDQDFAIRITDKSNDMVFGKISKKQFYHFHEKSAEDIRDINIEDWPYLGFVCDTREGIQLLTIEYDSRFMYRIGRFSETLSELANIHMFKYGYSVSFEPIVDDKSFWGLVKSAEGVYAISFSLSSPNIFGAESYANEALKELRNTFNNNKVNVTLINDNGKLVVPEETIESYRDYADRGGGNWKITIQKKNKKRRYLSTERAIKITVEAEERANPDTLKKALLELLSSI